ncbi:AMP-binding protein [Campylobacter concisus]
MEFENSLKDFKFVDTDKNLYSQVVIFGANLKEYGPSEVEIYLSETFDFCVAFFGALAIGVRPILLAKPIFSSDKFNINDENFKNFLTPARNIEPKFDINSTFFLQTSGSTGSSKNIQKRLGAMIEEGLFLKEELGVNESDTFFSSVSHQHMFGLTFKVFLPIISGAKVVSKELNYPEAIFELELENLSFITSPVLLQTLISSPRAAEISGLKNIICAGSALKSELRASIAKLSKTRIIDIYGSTETGAVARNLGDELLLFSKVKAGLNEDEALNVSSPWCEFFQTSDWAEIKGSRLTLKGRIDRIVKLNDKRVNLISIENKMLESGLLKDCYCDTHPKFKRLAALLELSEEGVRLFRDSGKKGVVARLNELLRPEFKNSVRYFKIVSSLCKNAQGKFLKANFKELLEKNEEFVWEKSSENGIYKFKTKLSPALGIFMEHFPNLPLLPGFVQLDFVFKFAREIGAEIGDQCVVENLKFLKFVRPNDEFCIEISQKDEKVYFEIFCNGTKSAGGRIKLGL